MSEGFSAETGDSRIPYFSRVSGAIESPAGSQVTQFNNMLRRQELRKLRKDVLDDAGNKIGVIEYDPQTQEIIAIYPERYVNVEGTAEHPEEKIYITDAEGNVMPERLTRAEARAAEKRYLMVTTLIFRGDNVLIQERSLEKDIDAGKTAASANGVAKELFSESRERITDGQTVALINTALEINEELRHDTAPFVVRIWPGDSSQLYEYAEANHINDPNTVWLVPQEYSADDRYPLKSGWGPRTRAFSAGFIFSNDEPDISIDPAELQGVEWKAVSKFLQDSRANLDLPRVGIEILEKIVERSPLVRKYGAAAGEHLIRHYRGLPPHDKP